jgi:hypothetical protein
MNAFAAAMATLAADRNIGTDVVWYPGGSGPGVAIRAVRSSPDRVAGAFDTAIVQATDVVTVATSAAPTLAAGDTFVIGSDTLTVQHIERSAFDASTTAFCRRN